MRIAFQIRLHLLRLLHLPARVPAVDEELDLQRDREPFIRRLFRQPPNEFIRRRRRIELRDRRGAIRRRFGRALPQAKYDMHRLFLRPRAKQHALFQPQAALRRRVICRRGSALVWQVRIGTLLEERETRELRYGLATMCVGGGMGIATIFDRI